MRRLLPVLLILASLPLGCNLLTRPLGRLTPASTPTPQINQPNAAVTTIGVEATEPVMVATPANRAETGQATQTLTSPAEPFVLVTLPVGKGQLVNQLRVEVKQAKALNLRPFAFWTAEWCENCKELEASLADPGMVKAFNDTYIIRIDLDVWNDQGPKAGMYVIGVPAFFELDDEGHSTGRSITGAAWDANTPANMSSPLEAFFQPEE